MKLTNSTPWPTWFLRRMISWICRELEMPIKPVRFASFRNSRSSWGGLCYGPHRIGVCVSKHENNFPATSKQHAGAPFVITFSDRTECLVEVTAHELAHARNWRTAKCRRGNPGGSEALTDTLSFRVLETFRKARAELLAEWNAIPVVALRRSGPQLTVPQRRKIKAHAELAKWERRLKLASGKVRKLRRRVKYYETKTTTNE